MALNLLQHVAERTAGEIRADRDVAATVVAGDALRTRAEGHARDVLERHEPRAPRHEHRTDPLHVTASVVVEPHTDGNLPLRQVELRQAHRDVAAGGDARGRTQRFRRNAELGGALRNRLDQDFRLHEARRGLHVRQPGAAQLLLDLLRDRVEQARIVAGEADLHLLAEVAGTEGDAHAGNVANTGAAAASNAAWSRVRSPLRQQVQRQRGAAHFATGLLTEAGRPRRADRRVHMGDVGERARRRRTVSAAARVS